MVLVWQITDDLPNSPNFLPAKLSHYTVHRYCTKTVTFKTCILLLIYVPYNQNIWLRKIWQILPIGENLIWRQNYGWIT